MMQDPGNQLTEVLLERLQDIHATAQPGFWPPAPGWWVVAGIVLAAILYGMFVLTRKLRVLVRRRRLLRELEALQQAFDPATQPSDYLDAISRLFRAIALRAFPRSNCARLQGEAWVSFIRERLPGADAHSLEALNTGPYRQNPEFNAADLTALARRWVSSHG